LSATYLIPWTSVVQSSFAPRMLLRMPASTFASQLSSGSAVAVMFPSSAEL
jgi:hypothetical protein